MKKYLPLILIIFVQSFRAQTELRQGFEKTRADFIVPISPAFEIIDEKPSNIVEPGSLREIAAIFGSTNSNPNSFGIETAPFILFSKPSLPEYKSDAAKRFLYRTRLSAAFIRNINTQVSAGLRFTLIDETDLRLDEGLSIILSEYARTYSTYLNDCLRDLNEDDPDLERKAAECADEQFTDDIRRVRDQAKSKKWNKTIIETGIASSGLSRDSLLKNLLLNRMALWFTAGLPLGEGGQIFFGLKGLVSRLNDKFDNNEASFAARGYYGRNDLRGYLEVDSRLISNTSPNYSAFIGGEVNISNGIWVDLSFGLSAQKYEKAYFVNSFNLRFATPEIGVK